LNIAAVGAVAGPLERFWTSTDCLLYALGIGAGEEDLAFTTENTESVAQQVYPTFAVIPGVTIPDVMTHVGPYDRSKLVHAEQSIELAGPLPVEGRVTVTSRITEIADKGSGALVRVATDAVDPDSGDLRFRCVSSVFIRGEGGFGGPRGESVRIEVPDREPDHRVTYPTRRDQALLYRLSGDRNPLHSDPAFARRGGFSRPILHGLCTYGFTGRALLAFLCDNDPARFRSMHGRFTSPVLPGDQLTVAIWRQDDGAVFETRAEGERVVLVGQCRTEGGR